MARCNQVLGFWVDEQGNPATTFWNTLDQSDAVPSGLISLLNAAKLCTTAGLVAVQYQTTHYIGGSGSGGSYPSIYDRAVFRSRMSTTGARVMTEIPCPKIEILNSDHQTIDLTNSLVVDFQTALMAYTGDPLGHAVGPFLQGQRQRAKGGS